MEYHIYAEISDKYTRTCAMHIQNGDLKDYTTNGTLIFKKIDGDTYSNMLTGKVKCEMEELGIPAKPDVNYKNKQ